MAMTIHPQPPLSSVTNHRHLYRSPPSPSPTTTTTIVHQPSLPSRIYTSPSLNRLARSPNTVVFLPLCYYRRSFSIIYPSSAITVVLLQSSIHHLQCQTSPMASNLVVFNADLPSSAPIWNFTWSPMRSRLSIVFW
ncbi:hypothetical protein CsSME_00036818 [Camellia sinensis var. sinensis]